MEIAIISGKGGTGKSSISAAFATIGKNILVADCDVDAANLYIIFEPSIEEELVYISGQKAEIDPIKCRNCGYCITFCRFDAIKFQNSKTSIIETSCDGCKLCSYVCPENAIIISDCADSRIYSGSFRNGKMVYGRLAPGEENSGKLVGMVREKAKKIASENQIETIIIDGPPGIGCPVISTITGVDKVLIVTEPTLSGLHDLERAIELTQKFNLKPWVLINKYDINLDMSQKIENFCLEKSIKIAGKIEFDELFIKALAQRKSIIEWDRELDISQKIINIFNLITTDVN
jgi:MinD superfamily P-loop ATPase